MKKEVIVVPKGISPLYRMEALAEKTKKWWIFIHRDIIHYFEERCDEVIRLPKDRNDGYAHFLWNPTVEHPKLEVRGFVYLEEGIWPQVSNFDIGNTSFYSSDDPDEIFFLQMEE